MTSVVQELSYSSEQFQHTTSSSNSSDCAHCTSATGGFMQSGYLNNQDAGHTERQINREHSALSAKDTRQQLRAYERAEQLTC